MLKDIVRHNERLSKLNSGTCAKADVFMILLKAGMSMKANNKRPLPSKKKKYIQRFVTIPVSKRQA